MSSEVCSVLTGGNDVAEEHRVDNVGVNGGLRHCCRGGHSAEFSSGDAFERATEAAKGRSLGGDNENVGQLARGHL